MPLSVRLPRLRALVVPWTGLPPETRTRLRAGDWRVRYDTGRGLRLDGSAAVVLGHGEIGARVARALHALGVRVRAVRRTAPAAARPAGAGRRGSRGRPRSRRGG